MKVKIFEPGTENMDDNFERLENNKENEIFDETENN